MAGHSKWANIQHRKGRQDEKRGKVWTRITREIIVAARQGAWLATSFHPELTGDARFHAWFLAIARGARRA